MICYVTMVEPCTLPCKHTFCIQCLTEFFERKRECALCRRVPPATFKLNIDTAKQALIKKAAPKTYEAEAAKLA